MLGCHPPTPPAKIGFPQFVHQSGIIEHSSDLCNRSGVVIKYIGGGGLGEDNVTYLPYLTYIVFITRSPFNSFHFTFTFTFMRSGAVYSVDIPGNFELNSFDN